MSSTVFVDVTQSVWVQVMAAALTGRISNEGSKPIRVVESTGLPATSVNKGHTINPGASLTFTTSAGQEIYARGVTGASFVAVTSA